MTVARRVEANPRQRHAPLLHKPEQQGVPSAAHACPGWLQARQILQQAAFFALEMFFRGCWLGVLRKSFGSGAIFAMAVPYCMIHRGKPYLEAVGAIVAGNEGDQRDARSPAKSSAGLSDVG